MYFYSYVEIMTYWFATLDMNMCDVGILLFVAIFIVIYISQRTWFDTHYTIFFHKVLNRYLNDLSKW